MDFEKAKELGSGWKKCQKKVYSVTMYVPTEGTSVHNKLENSDYVTDKNKPFVLIGTVGEEWTIDSKKLINTYTYNGTQLTPAILEKLSDGKKYKLTTKGKDSPIQWCRKANGKEKIATSCGETLEANRSGIPHGSGDYVVATDAGNSPNESDKWVVNGEVFKATYNFV